MDHLIKQLLTIVDVPKSDLDSFECVVRKALDMNFDTIKDEINTKDKNVQINLTVNGYGVTMDNEMLSMIIEYKKINEDMSDTLIDLNSV